MSASGWCLSPNFHRNPGERFAETPASTAPQVAGSMPSHMQSHRRWIRRVLPACATSHMVCAPSRDEPQPLLQSAGRCPAVATVDTGMETGAGSSWLELVRSWYPDPRRRPHLSSCRVVNRQHGRRESFDIDDKDTLRLNCNRNIEVPGQVVASTGLWLLKTLQLGVAFSQSLARSFIQAATGHNMVIFQMPILGLHSRPCPYARNRRDAG
jgi:hypothetical protein